MSFEFSEVGYVKDDDGADLDADAILESIRQGNDQANEARRRRHGQHGRCEDGQASDVEARVGIFAGTPARVPHARV